MKLLRASAWIAVAMAAPSLRAEDAPRPSFKSLRYDEDYRFLADPARRGDAWDTLKYIPLSEGAAGFLSIGGEARERFEAYENEFFSSNPDADNAYFLQRYLLHADYHPSDWLRAFGQLQASFEDGRDGGPRPTDRDGVDIHQLFFDLSLATGEEGKLTLRSGRQEMSYGSERLISIREGPNNRRAFDAVRLLYRQDDLSVDAFIASPVEVDEGAFDDDRIRDVWLWGAYATLPLRALPGMKMDFYYLGLHDPDASYDLGDGKEERHTIGTRFFGKRGSWDFNQEALYQFGSFNGGDISAWSVATDQGYTLGDLWGKPRLGLKAAIASGDRGAGKGDLETFSPLFPRGTYFTEASLLGPQNFIDVHPSLRLQPFEKWTIETGADFYWRESLDDGIYKPSGSVIYGGNPAYSRFVGTDLSCLVGWQASRHLSISASYTHFFTGGFIEQNGGHDVNYGSVWATYRF